MSSTRSFTILGIDISGYSRKEDLELVSIQEDADSQLGKVCEDIGIAKESLVWIDAGDGGLLLVPDDVSLALRIAQGHVERMRWNNHPKMKEHRITLRYAIHWGFVHSFRGYFGTKHAGSALTVCTRILDGMVRNRNGAIAVSEVYRTTLAQHARFDETAFVDQEPIVDKHNNRHVYHLIRGSGDAPPDP